MSKHKKADARAGFELPDEPTGPVGPGGVPSGPDVPYEAPPEEVTLGEECRCEPSVKQNGYCPH